MTVTEVLEHFGGVAETSRALKITYQAVDQWVEKNAVPEGRQWQIQALTDGKLQVDEPLSA